MAEMADAIGEKQDALTFREHAGKIAQAFTKAYIDSTGAISKSSQSGYAMAFTMGLVPETLREQMSNRFVEECRRFDWHPTTGFIGTPRLLPGLHNAGRDEDAYKLLLAKTSPSWLYPVTVGATTIWERWDGWDGKRPQGGMNSLNHYSFGAVGEYLFRMIGGISEESPGYQHIRIAPVIRNGLSNASTSYNSIHGKIRTSWKVTGRKLDLEVTRPANTMAIVVLPAKNSVDVTESAKPISKVLGVKFLRMEHENAVYAIESGNFHFQSTLPEPMK
jgi:alpha-L-rhamnosidase